MGSDTRSRILPKRHTSLGWAITEIGYSAVPNYDLAAAKKGLSPAAIQTELERNWLASQDKAIYPEFNPTLHVSPERLPFDPHAVFWVGIDMPGCPAAVVTQLDVFGRWCILSNLSPPEHETIGYYEFGEALAEHLHRTYARPHGMRLWDLRLEFVGDPAGWAKIPRPGESPKEARAAYEILRDGIVLRLGYDERGDEIVEERLGWGWEVQPGPVNRVDREEPVRARLSTLLHGGVPAIVIDPDCRTVIEGFGGAHCIKQRSDGRWELDPFKGFHSHTINALEYVCAMLFPDERPEEDEDDDRGYRQEFKSAARGRVRGAYR